MSSQMGIGLSSNLAQIALSYSYTFPDKKYQDYVSILSVLAQIYIDSSKRAYDIDLNEETKRIQRDLNIKANGYPIFFKPIQKYNNKRNGMGNFNISADRYNESIRCPMNVLYNMELNTRMTEKTNIIPMDQFFIKHKLELSTTKSRKVEHMIEKYNLKIYNYQKNVPDDSKEEILLLQNDFDQLIADIKQLHIGKKYRGLMSYLLDRALLITGYAQGHRVLSNSKTNTNRAVLLKTLFTISPEDFLACFVQKD